MTMHDHFRLLAGYNRWANRRLYDAVAMLPADEYRKDRRGFFRSIHGTLNHILVADRIWLRRFTGAGPAPTRLDEILYEDFAALRSARSAEDARIVDMVDRDDEASLERKLAYRNMAGESFEQPLAPVYDHFFNHQTHHRGQVHDMLSQTGMKPPDLDLLYYMRETGV